MIEFHAGSGWDSQAVGIALEEMFLDYRLMPVRAPVPVIAMAGARLPGMSGILTALARRTGRFLPDADAATPWLKGDLPAPGVLAERLSNADYILGAFTIADMAVYPRLLEAPEPFGSYASVRAWTKRMALRPATGRGLGVFAP